MIADRPDAAYEVCTKYAPNCPGGQSTSASSLSGSRGSASSSSGGSSRGSLSRSPSTMFQREESSGRQTSSSRNAGSSHNAASSNQGSFSSNQGAFSNGLGLDASAASRNLNRNGNRNSFDAISNLELPSQALNGASASVSRDNSGESDGMGISLNGEDDYYDSLNSADENEMSSARPNRTRPLIEPVYNPEPGIHDLIPEGEFDEANVVNENASSEATTFSTIVNGVKIKSLPGPRGKNQKLL